MGGANSAVSMVAAYMTQGAAANVSNVSTSKNSSNAAITNFDNILNKVSDTFVQTKTVDVSKDVNKQLADAKETNATDTNTVNLKDQANNTNAALENASEADQVTESQVMATNETGNTEVNEELQEAINEAGEEIISQIAETFDISEEEIVDAMQILGLMAVDLLDPANLTQLVTEIQGQGEVIDFITDSDIYTSLQDLMEGAESMKSGLMNEFDLSEEELQTAIEDAKQGFGAALENSADETAKFLNGEELSEEFGKEIDLSKVNASVSEALQSSETEEKPIVIETDNKNSGENKGNLQGETQSTNLFNQVMNNIADAATEVDTSSFNSYTDRTQMEDIIRQITERITITQSQTDTSIEMQLHPASLGHVNILLTSGKDGIVAKFTAQNEIVKEAVEAQMAQLQQKFNEQGIKVTSVEVTIASHGFEQNLDQQGDRQPREASQDKKVKGLRRINLSELSDDEMEEPETEAERIAVSMMEANGSTVDFSA
ncbi:MAG: flagellar hook-length control protein FliK [Butyrivibrio sp.]|nr:flagellar hook-length control protein FliK [Butyrivibrio sp.]